MLNPDPVSKHPDLQHCCEQGCGSAFILDRDTIRIQGFDDQKFKKIYSWKKVIFFWIKNCPGHRRSLQLSKENIQPFKTWNFLIFFYFCVSSLPSWIQIRVPSPDPDPLTLLNPDPIRIRIRNPGCKDADKLIIRQNQCCESGFNWVNMQILIKEEWLPTEGELKNFKD